MIRPIVVALLLVSATVGAAEDSGKSGFRFREIGECSESGRGAYGPDKLRARRNGASIVVSGQVAMNCAASPRNPTADFTPASVSLSFEELSETGEYVRCKCSKKIEFTLLERVAPGTPILLLRNGTVSARTSAP